MTSDLLGNLDDNPGTEQPIPADEPEAIRNKNRMQWQKKF
jgi:hypothetical protein